MLRFNVIGLAADDISLAMTSRMIFFAIGGSKKKFSAASRLDDSLIAIFCSGLYRA